MDQLSVRKLVMTGAGLLSDGGGCVFTHVLQLKDLPKPSFMGKTIEELAIGTYTKVISVSTGALGVSQQNRHHLCTSGNRPDIRALVEWS